MEAALKAMKNREAVGTRGLTEICYMAEKIPESNEGGGGWTIRSNK